MLFGGATLPPAETLIVEGVLLPPEEALPLLPAEDGVTESEEVTPPPPLLVGAGPCGEKALSFGGFISMRKRKDFAALPAETLVVEDELLLPEEEPPLAEDVLAAREEVPPPLLLFGAGLFGAGALSFGGSIFKLAGRPVIEMNLPNANDPDVPGVARVRIALFKAVSLRVPDREPVAL